LLRASSWRAACDCRGAVCLVARHSRFSASLLQF
jgi:hypothetical protein